MSKLEELEKKVIDTSWEHSQHSEFRKDCSSCFVENMVAKQPARRDPGEVMEHNRRTLNRTFNGESPWDRSRD